MSTRTLLVAGAAVVALSAGIVGAIGLVRSGSGGPAPAERERPAELTETVNPSPGGAADYWTPERMRSAEPAPMPEGRDP